MAIPTNILPKPICAICNKVVDRLDVFRVVLEDGRPAHRYTIVAQCHSEIEKVEVDAEWIAGISNGTAKFEIGKAFMSDDDKLTKLLARDMADSLDAKLRRMLT